MARLAFWEQAEERPDHVALIAPDGRAVAAGALLAAAHQVVHGLRALGVKAGDTIAVLLDNDAPLIEVCLAAAQAGLYVTPINVHLTAPEIRYILSDCEARVFIAAAAHGEPCRRAAREAGLPEHACFATEAIEGFLPYEQLKAGQPTAHPEGRSAGLVMTYTSGTTGSPKGVRRPLIPVDPETIAESYAKFLMLFGITPRDEGVHLVVSPLYHTAVLNFCMNHLHFGHTVVLCAKFDPEAVLRAIDEHRVTTSHLVPTHFSRLLALPESVRNQYGHASLRHVIHSAAPCPVLVKERMLAWWGPVIYEYYAASEGGGTLATPAEWLARPGTVGKAWPISQVRILDDAGEPLAPRAVGTVYLQMGQHRFEYHKDKPKTASAWREGFFTVGDAGYLDEDGFLFLCDRKADMIISGGVNIYPAEIEAAMLAHPQVADVCVFGIPDDDWGERVKAVVEPAAGAAGSAALGEDILSFCRERLAGYKCPRSIEFMTPLPRDPNGKLYKRKLRDPYWQDRQKAI